MKEKRYFCDKINKPLSRPWKIAIVSSFIIVTVIVIIVIHNIDINVKYEGEFAEYSEEVYENLEKIADNVIGENVINRAAIPDDVSDYEIKYENGVLTFKCSINHYEGKKLHPSARITVTESSGVVKKERNVSSKEEYIRFQKRSIIMGDVLFGILICAVGAAAISAVLLILYMISYTHKKSDTKKQKTFIKN